MDFRKKLLVLSASAMAFAGVASAAASTPCPGPANLTGLPNLLRLEGTNDLVTDLDIGCGTGATLTQGTVVVALTGTVTSHQVSKALNEATLRILFGTSSSSTYAGTVSGSQVNFGVVTFPTATSFQMDVANIRVNSSLLSANQYVTETLNVYNKGVLAFFEHDECERRHCDSGRICAAGFCGASYHRERFPGSIDGLSAL